MDKVLTGILYVILTVLFIVFVLPAWILYGIGWVLQRPFKWIERLFEGFTIF